MTDRLTIAIALLLATALTASAQEKKLIRGFDGGMMVHSGYLTGRRHRWLLKHNVHIMTLILWDGRYGNPRRYQNNVVPLLPQGR